MRRNLLWRLFAVVAAGLILGAGFASGARAAVTGNSGGGALGAAMLTGRDLPDGFAPYAPLTGPVNAQRAQDLGINLNALGPQALQVRAWIWSHHAEVIEIAADAGTDQAAQAAVSSAATTLLKQGAARQRVTGTARSAAFGLDVQTSSGKLFVLTVPMARGPYFFVLHVYVAAAAVASADSLMSSLATAQASKVPADTPGTESGDNPASAAAGGTVGALLSYLLIVDGIAYLRNPLRRRLWRRARRLPSPGTIDVSAAAKKNKRAAVWRMAVQLTGVALVAAGIDAHFVRYWYVYLVAGLAVVWAGGRFIHPAGAGRDKNRAVLAGSHKVLVMGLLAAGSAAILAGFAFAVLYGLYQALPQTDTVTLVPGQAPTPVQSASSGLLPLALGLVAAGAIIFRIARRLGAIHARQLMDRDTRPPVLYLRAFGDDRLKLWTAAFGRPSLVERFTVRRFDTFEEVIVRYLSRYGPVIAVNPPRTRLAPLGAARQTIDSPDWQATVAGWMAQAGLIVFVAPPTRLTPGVQWELETVSGHGFWPKALVLVPPVRADKLQDRWQQFRAAPWPFTVPGATTDPRALTLTFRNGQWQVTTARRRTEWSYGAALAQALGDSPRRTASRKVPARIRD